MPTFDVLPRFAREYRKLTRTQAQAFRLALDRFLDGLRTGIFDPSLRVHRIEATDGVWSLTWAPDGRATFTYGPELRAGEPPVIWRRVGDHSVYRRP